jgi:hypothetical protein
MARFLQNLAAPFWKKIYQRIHPFKIVTRYNGAFRRRVAEQPEFTSLRRIACSK